MLQVVCRVLWIPARVGHYAGDVSRKALSIDLQIKIPKEQRDSGYLAIKKEIFFQD